MNTLSNSDSVSVNLINTLSELPHVSRFWVAFSGGMDSHVLLHSILLNKHLFIDKKIAVCHINHGMISHSSKWEQYCRSVCNRYNVDYYSNDIRVVVGPGESKEAAAREARYTAFSKFVNENECLLTAHHLNDQVETVLIHLLRGSGLDGLSGMSSVSKFNSGWLVRPFLQLTRQQLQSYANKYKLDWVEDESNLDINFDRNYIRHELIPVIQHRWPGFTKTIMRSSEHCRNAAQALDALVSDYVRSASGSSVGTLSISKLIGVIEQKGSEFCRLILRKWIKDLKLSTPQSVHINHIISDLIYAKIDSNACLKWNDVEIRRYRDELYAMLALNRFDPTKIHAWDGIADLELEDGVLSITKTLDSGIDASLWNDKRITVRFRHGGEKIHALGGAHTKTLKKLFQESAIPPWIRNRLPLIFIDSELVLVVGYWINHNYAAQHGKPGIQIEFRLKNHS